MCDTTRHTRKWGGLGTHYMRTAQVGGWRPGRTAGMGRIKLASWSWVPQNPALWSFSYLHYWPQAPGYLGSHTISQPVEKIPFY